MTKQYSNAFKASEFYKQQRPERFSDSAVVSGTLLPEQILAFELSQITTNQKQDQFETLCRKLAEKLIAPNLIPQVGPTGGGDGKTDFETHPVSEFVSCRWFIPENCWDKGEKWAFAISAKEKWQGKVKSDIESILSTGREYTKVFFMTNQTPSSKKKKDAQDDLSSKYNIEVIILDGKWILEKTYSNNLVDLVVDALNLSAAFKSEIHTGPNDSKRLKQLEEIEANISNPNRYFEYDFQLVEDALEAANLSKMLERPRDEVEGKFDRALRFCKKVGSERQLIRLHYQRAWTYFTRYDDYVAFVEEYKEFKSYISVHSNIVEIELYVNLFNLLRGLSCLKDFDLSRLQIEMAAETENLLNFLNAIAGDESKPCSSLIAKTYLAIQQISDAIIYKEQPDSAFQKLASYISQSQYLLDYPFECIQKIIEEMGRVFPNNVEFDNLFDCVAEVAASRSSDLSAGQIYLKRGGQKFLAENYVESIVYFGKAVIKLAKEETQHYMYITLMALAEAYSALGLYWASNHSLVSACFIAVQSWYKSGVMTDKVYRAVVQLTRNELCIGRIPSFLAWYELFKVVSKQVNVVPDENELPDDMLADSCFAIRLLNTDIESDEFTLLPELLANEELWFSQQAALFKLGYEDLVAEKHRRFSVDDGNDLHKYFEQLASQPFRHQMIYPTNFMAEENVCLSAKIQGCVFEFRFVKDKETLLTAELLLAFFECFLATSLTGIYPTTEKIVIDLERNTDLSLLRFHSGKSPSKFKLEFNCIDATTMAGDKWHSLLEFVVSILVINFAADDLKEHLKSLFENEEIMNKLSLVFEHEKFTCSILGDNPKLFFQDWLAAANFKEYPMKRNEPICFKFDDSPDIAVEKQLNQAKERHDNRKVLSVIETTLWSNAKWHSFGFYGDRSGLAVMLVFENGDLARNIFDNWIERFGREDKDELIKITIIKGVDSKNPYWYRVHIATNINEGTIKKGELPFVVSTYTEMTPDNPENLAALIHGFEVMKKYRLIPAVCSRSGGFIDPYGGNIEPYVDKGIMKKTLFIKNAWEIGIHDMESTAIRKNDHPIIPNHVKNAPVLELIRSKQTPFTD